MLLYLKKNINVFILTLFCAIAITFAAYLITVLIAPFYGSSYFMSFFLLYVILNELCFITLLIVYKYDEENFFLHPLTICIALTFFVQCSFPILQAIYTSPVEVWNLNFIFWDDDPYKYLIKPMWLVILSLLSIIMGFYSSISKKIGSYLNSKFLYIREFGGKDSTISTFVILVVISLGTLSLIYRINAGIYGYGVSDELLAQYAHLDQIFSLIAGLQLLLILYLSYKKHSSLKNKYLIQNYILWPLTIFISFQGILFGSKGATIFPFLCVVIGSYFAERRLRINYVALTAMVLFLSFIIIEPYRVLKNIYPDATFIESISLIRTIPDELEEESVEEDMTTFERLVELSLWMLARSDNFSFSANVITYKDKFGIPDNDNPMFLQSIIFSPAYAFIPRTVWRSKPRDQIGAWYEDTILQSPFYSAAAMGPWGYAYVAGGYIGTVLIFFFFGFFQRIIYEWFGRTRMLPFALAYIALILPITWIFSELGGVITGFLRYLPIVTLGIFILFFNKQRISF